MNGYKKPVSASLLPGIEIYGMKALTLSGIFVNRLKNWHMIILKRLSKEIHRMGWHIVKKQEFLGFRSFYLETITLIYLFETFKSLNGDTLWIYYLETLAVLHCSVPVSRIFCTSLPTYFGKIVRNFLFYYHLIFKLLLKIALKMAWISPKTKQA